MTIRKISNGYLMKIELKQCPYCKATKCIMDEPCDGCETYPEYMRKKIVRFRNVKIIEKKNNLT